MKKRRETFGKIGLVLSGGAGKSLFHVGALTAIVKNNINFSYIVAVSGGAVAAAKLLEVLPDVEELEKAALIKLKNPPFLTNRELFMHPMKAKSLFDNAPLKKLVSELDVNKIIASPVEMQVVTANFRTGKERVFSNRNSTPEAFAKAIIASTALPGMFKPEIIGDEVLIDGGMLNSLPIKNAIVWGCDTVIAIDTNPAEDPLPLERYPRMGWLEILSRGYGFPGKQLVEKEIIRTLRINKNIAGLKVLQKRILKAVSACDDTLREKIDSIFEEVHFYFEYRKRIKLAVIRPLAPLLLSSLSWNLDDAKKMIAEGKKTAEEALKKACLI